MPSERWRRTSSSRAESGQGSLIRGAVLARAGQLVEQVAQAVGAEAAALGAGAQPLRRDRLALGVVGDHVGGGDHRRQAVGVLGVVALDRDRDPLRQVPAPGEDAADQGVVDAELLAFVAQALLGGAGDGVEVDLVAGVQAGDDEPADVVEQRRDGELVAFDPADGAADLVGGPLGGEGVDAEALRASAPSRRWTRRSRRLGAVPAIASTPEGFSTSIASGMLATPPATTPLRLAKRRTEIVRATSDSTASTRSPIRAVSAVAARDHPLAGLDQDREALDRLEGLREAAAGSGLRRAIRWPFAARCGVTFARSDFAVGLGGRCRHSAYPSAAEDVRFSRKYPR